MAPVLWKVVAGKWRGKKLISIDLNQSNVYSLPKERRAAHIHHCRQKEYANSLSRLQSDLVYCFQCFAWFVKREWRAHCRQHLDSISSRRCGSITYCHTVIRPARCLFCLGNETLSAEKRLQEWKRDADLMPHLENHISETSWPSGCPHPLCNLQIQDETSFWYHLNDAHNLHRCNIKGRKRSMKDVVSEDSDSILFEQSESSHGVKKKWKSMQSKETLGIKVTDYSPPKLSPTSADGRPQEQPAIFTDPVISPTLTLLSSVPDLSYSPDSCPTGNGTAEGGGYYNIDDFDEEIPRTELGAGPGNS
jgi:hypothetical protein